MVRLRRSVARRPKSKDGQKRAHLIIQGGNMSRKWLLFLFCLSLLMVLAPLSRAGLTLRVKESAIRVLFEEQGTRVVLAVENSLGPRVDAHIKLELIDTDGAPRATVAGDYQIKPGAHEVMIPISL